MNIEKVDLVSHGDSRGQLVAIEEYDEIPFKIKRVYYIYDTNSDVTRGCHAHRTLKQLLVCVSGNCKIRLDDGKESQIVLLDKPNEGILICDTIWREMFDFSKDAVLLVLASDIYDEKDYIRDYQEFLKYVTDKGNGKL